MFGKRKTPDDKEEEENQTRKKQKTDHDNKLSEKHVTRGFGLFNLIFPGQKHTNDEKEYFEIIINEIADRVIEFNHSNKYMKEEIATTLENILSDISVIFFTNPNQINTLLSSSTKQEYVEKIKLTQLVIHKFMRFFSSCLHYYYITKYHVKIEDMENDNYPIEYLKQYIYGFYEESQNIENIFTKLTSEKIPENVNEIINNNNLHEPKILSMLGGRKNIKDSTYLMSFSYFASMSNTKKILEDKANNLKSIPEKSQAYLENNSLPSNFIEYKNLFIENFKILTQTISKNVISAGDLEIIEDLKNKIFLDDPTRYQRLINFFTFYSGYLWSLHRINQTKERIKIVLLQKSGPPTYVSQLLKNGEDVTTVSFDYFQKNDIVDRFIIVDKPIQFKSVLFLGKDTINYAEDVIIGGLVESEHKMNYCLYSDMQFLKPINWTKNIPNDKEIYESQIYPSEMPKYSNKMFEKSKKNVSSNEMVIDTKLSFFNRFKDFTNLINKYGKTPPKFSETTIILPFLQHIKEPIFDTRLNIKNDQRDKENIIRFECSFTQLYKKYDIGKNTSANNMYEPTLDDNFKFVFIFSKSLFLGIIDNNRKYKLKRDDENNDQAVLEYDNIDGNKQYPKRIQFCEWGTLANIGFDTNIKFYYDDENIKDFNGIFGCFILIKRDSGINIDDLNNLDKKMTTCSANNIFNIIYQNDRMKGLPLNNSEFQKEVYSMLYNVFTRFNDYSNKKKNGKDSDGIDGELILFGLIHLTIDTYLIDRLVYLSLLHNLKNNIVVDLDNDLVTKESVGKITQSGSLITQKLYHSGSYIDISDTDDLDYNRVTLFKKIITDTMNLSEEYCKNKMMNCESMLYILTRYFKNWFSIRSMYPIIWKSRSIKIKADGTHEIREIQTNDDNEKIKKIMESTKRSTEKLKENTDSFLYLLKSASSNELNFETYQKKSLQSFLKQSNDIFLSNKIALFAMHFEALIKDYVANDTRLKSENIETVSKAKMDYIEMRKMFREMFVMEMRRLSISQSMPPGSVYLTSNPVFEI